MIAMDPAQSPHPAPDLKALPPARDPLARLALGLSIFAFLPPFGIAAVVLGHVAESRMTSGNGAANDRKTARAALWIAYLQLALVGLIAVVVWGLFQNVADGFRGDAMVQRVFRVSDQFKTLDPESARQAEETARTLLNEFIAIEDQVHRKDGSYICQINELAWTGLEDSTDAERSALAARIADSPYIYEVRDCTPVAGDSPERRYTLVAVPRSPRMPEGSAIFCTDRSGVIRSSHGRTSLDCLNHEKSASPEPEIPRILK